MPSVESVYLLWHSFELHGCEEVKLIGVYAHDADALEAQRRVEQKPGFNERRHGFEIVAYQIGKDHWTEGFVTL